MRGGIEFGGTKCILAVAKNPLEIIEKKIIPTRDPENTFLDIISFFGKFKIDNLGIGVFGPIILDKESADFGLLVTESKKGWKGVNIVTNLSERLGVNILIDTDVNAAAIGEYYYGAGQLAKSMVYVTVGTGIGVGVLSNGKPHIGNFHLEVGHMQIPNLDQFHGICRIHGDCWEGLASGPSIESRWGEPGDKLPKSHEAWEKEAELLANGLINIISNHSPDKIILGGGVMNQKHLYPLIRSKVKKMWNDYTPLGSLADLILEPGLGNDSGIIGSLSLERN